MNRRQVGTAIALLSLFVIAANTLTPMPGQAAEVAETPPWCLVCGYLGGTDVLANIVLFLPLGIGLALMGWRPRWIIVGAACLTMGVETLQLTVIAGRDGTLSDILTNTMGAAAGLGLVALAPRWWCPGERAARALFVAAALAWLTVCGVTSWGLNVDLPATIYFGGWAPDLGHFVQFPGTVQAATVGGLAVPNGPFVRSSDLRNLLLTDSVTVATEAVAGHPTRALAPIFSIFDENESEIVLLGQDGRAATFRIRQRSNHLRLRPLTIGTRNAFTGHDRDSVVIAGGIRGGEAWIRAISQAGIHEWAVPRSPGLGWTLVMPWPFFLDGRLLWLGSLWLGAWAFPMGFWSGRHSRSGSPVLVDISALAATVVLGLGALPALIGPSAATPPDWTGAFVGSGLAWIAGRYLPGNVEGRSPTHRPGTQRT